MQRKANFTSSWNYGQERAGESPWCVCLDMSEREIKGAQ